MLVLPPRSGRYSWHPPSGRGPMRFQIDDRVKLVFPNGFSESSFAPRITQNFRLVGKQFIPFAIRWSSSGSGRKTMSLSLICVSYPFLPTSISNTYTFHLLKYRSSRRINGNRSSSVDLITVANQISTISFSRFRAIFDNRIGPR